MDNTRVLVFRAWCKPDHRFYYFIIGQFSECFERNDIYNQLCLDGVLFEQYTGLKDSTKWGDITESEREAWTRAGNMPSEWKGREIYEGDWCDVLTSDGRSTHAQVVFTDGCFELWFVSPVVIGGEYRARDYLKCLVVNHAVEVIGNIHENSDLLK